MTDLEDLWDDLPVGSAPTEKILREARRAAMASEAVASEAERKARGERRRRFLLRPLLTAGVATAVVGAFVAGTLIEGGDGGGDGTGGAGGGDVPSPAAFQADLKPAQDCDALLRAYVDRALPLVGPSGWRHPRSVLIPPLMPGDDPLLQDGPRIVPLDNGRAPSGMDGLAQGYNPAYKGAPDAGALDAPGTVRQTGSDTGTNVQEAGVDEPDTVKTDGDVLVRVSDDELVVYDVSGKRTQQLSSIDLTGVEDAELLLSGDTVLAIGTDDESAPRRPTTRLLTVSIADPRRPEVVDDVAYDARVESARQHDDAIRLVLSSGLPSLSFVNAKTYRGPLTATAHNRQVVKDSTIEDWLPTMTVGDGDPQPIVDCTDVAVPSDDLPLDRVSIVGFDAGDATRVTAIGLAGATNIAYESTDHLYLAESPELSTICTFCVTAGRVPLTTAPDDGTTYLFQFDLDGTAATHVASGEVEGRIPDRWAMDEAGGVLRVAVTPTSQTGDFTSVVTMKADGQDLVEVGRLDGLGRNEELKSVRWFDGLAILSTFRQVDPLYAIDLTDVRRPSVIGRLRIPGFSDYLHPLGPDRMIGIGQAAGPLGWGAQAALLDVTDLAHVRQLDVLPYGSNTQALAGSDPRSFTWLPGKRMALTVVAKWRGTREGWLSEMWLHRGQIHNTMVKVEYGDDVGQVRTVPLGDGRVVLVTGENVRFLDLGAT